MKIGFDAKRAFMNASGLGNYSRTLIHSLLQYFPEHHYYAYTPSAKGELGRELLESGKLKVVLPPEILRGFLSSWWRTSMISEDIRSHNLDVFHGLSNEIPKRLPFSTKKIVTVHDLIFLRHPEWYPLIDRNIYYKKIRRSCKQADVVVAVSEQTKKDIHYYLNIPEDKVKVIYQSCEERFFNQAEESLRNDFRKRMNLAGKFILYVGTIEERKNLLTLLQALLHVKDAALVVIGKKKAYYEKVSKFISSNQLQSRVFFPGNLEKGDLQLYFQCASVFVYPSRYEGFGIPVIEALCSGTPVITSDVSSLPEAGGTGSLYVNPDDSVGLTERLNQVLNQDGVREKMIRDGLAHVKQFHPAVTSARMMELYKGSLKS